MGIEIIDKLKNENFRFVLLHKWNEWGRYENVNGEQKIVEIKEFTFEESKRLPDNWKALGKVPSEYSWQNSNNYKFNDPKIISFLESGKNIGVVCGYGNLVILDIDDRELIEEFDKKLNTFSVKTGSGGRHYYLICEDKFNQSFFVLDNGAGELRVNNSQVLIPGDTHPTGNLYEINKNSQLLIITKTQLSEVLNGYVNFDKERTESKETKKDEKFTLVGKEFIENNILKNIGNDRIKVFITQHLSKELLNDMGCKSRSERDSSVITNLLLNGYGKYIKSVFDNFPVGDKYKEHPAPEAYLRKTIENSRKYTGVSNDLIISIEDEINDTGERILRGKLDIFLRKVLSIRNKVIQQYLISQIAWKSKINSKILNKRLTELINIERDVETEIVAENLLKEELTDIEYWVYPIIPKNSVIIFAGDPESYKSLFALSSALAIAGGAEKVLNTFKITEPRAKVLYYDLENGSKMQLRRMHHFINGGLVEKDKIKNLKFKFSFDYGNMDREIESCKDYYIIIMDSYRRFLQGDENNSETSNTFYKEFFQPLRNMGKTIIVIAHQRKGGSGDSNSSKSLRDKIRGSGDIIANPDIGFNIEKEDDIVDESNENIVRFDVSVMHSKLRDAYPIKNFVFTVERNDTTKATTHKFAGYKKKVSSKERAYSKILALLANGGIMSRTEIVEKIKEDIGNVSDVTIFRYLGDLVANTTIKQPKFGFYQVNDPQNREVISENNHPQKTLSTE